MSYPRDFLHQKIQWSDIDVSYLDQLIRLSRLEDLEGAGLHSVPFYQGDITTDSLFFSKKTSRYTVNWEKACFPNYFDFLVFDNI